MSIPDTCEIQSILSIIDEMESTEKSNIIFDLLCMIPDDLLSKINHNLKNGRPLLED